MISPHCDDGGHTSRAWDDDTWFAVEQLCAKAFDQHSLLDEYLPRIVDLRWPGLVPLVLLGGHPLRLELVHGELPEPIPVGPDVLAVDIEEDPDQPGSPWHAVIALEPATGPGACAELLSDCLDRGYDWRSPLSPESRVSVPKLGPAGEQGYLERYNLGNPCGWLAGRFEVPAELALPCCHEQRQPCETNARSNNAQQRCAWPHG